MPRTAIAFVISAFLLCATAADADEIKVATSGAFTAAYLDLAPQFERLTGHTLVTATTSSGVGQDSIANRLERREPIDVVIVASAALDGFVTRGAVASGSRTDLARSAIGLAVRAGAPKPDISTVDALKRTLLQAKSIAYSASVSGVYLSTELFQQLGIADQVLPKSRRIEGERVGAVVARGEAEIGFQQVSELLPVPGIDYVGPLPDGAQRVTMFSAGVGAAAAHPDAARAFIRFLASPGAIAAIRKSALDPVNAAEAELAAIEQTIMKSAVAGDRRTYSDMLAADWLTTDINGRLRTKDDVLEQLFGGPNPFAGAQIDDVQVRLFGDTAVVTGRTTATPKGGAAIVLRFTDVFVHREGRWQAVASQGTRIAS